MIPGVRIGWPEELHQVAPQMGGSFVTAMLYLVFVGILIIELLFALLIFNISRGRRWALWTFLVLNLLGWIFIAYDPSTLKTQGWLANGIDGFCFVLEVYVAYLLLFGEGRQWFKAQATIPTHQSAQPDSEPEQGSLEDAPAIGFWRALGTNLTAGFRGTFFLHVRPSGVVGTWDQLVVLSILALAVSFAINVAHVGLKGEFSMYALPGSVFVIPVFILAAWMTSMLAKRPAYLLTLVVGFTSIYFVSDIFFTLVFAAAEGGALKTVGRLWSRFGYNVPSVWFTFAAVVFSIRLLRVNVWRSIAVGFVSAFLLWAPLSHVYHDSALWVEPYDEDAVARRNSRTHTPVSEDVFYLQPSLLERELANLKPRQEGKINLFFVGAAGYASQDVFMKEVQFVSKQFKERFGTEGHSVSLINNGKTVMNSPIASGTSLKLALNRVGALMNHDEDILFLYLTSHGFASHKFSLDFYPMVFNDLDPQVLKKILDDSGIKRRVIVVSACYSGGFVEPLKNEDTLIITAAAPDKTSFGCSNEADFTYFGKAYFADSLTRTDSFIEAFDLAKPLIAEREKKDDYEHSDPRIFVGKNIKEALELFHQQLPPKINLGSTNSL